MNQFSDFIKSEEWKDPDLFGHLQEAQHLVVAFDSSGSHRKSKYEVFSFLVVRAETVGDWNFVRSELRQTFRLGARRLSFKALNDSRRREALIPFLTVAGTLAGSLIALAVHDRVLEYWRNVDVADLNEELDVGAWSKHPLERLVTFSHLCGLILGGLTHTGQSVLLVCDQDDIFANDALHINATKTMAWIGNHYFSHVLEKIRVATTRSDTGNLDLEDLCSISDLSAGALANFVNTHGASELKTSSFRPLRLETAPKTNVILRWMSSTHGFLRKSMFVWDCGQDGKKRFIRVQFLPDTSIIPPG